MTTLILICTALLALYAAGFLLRGNILTQATIDAPAQVVWHTLTTTQAYPDWNPFITSLDGDLAVGSRLCVKLRLGGKTYAFTPTVLTATLNTELRWLGRTGLPGLFDGNHSFRLIEQGDRTVLQHGETFRGLLVPLILPLIRRQTRAGFDTMNTALKTRSEAVLASQ